MTRGEFVELQETFSSPLAWGMWQEIVDKCPMSKRYAKYAFILKLEKGEVDWPAEVYQQAGPAERELLRMAYFRGLAKRL